MTGAELVSSLEKTLSDKLQRKIEFRGETTFVIASADLREVAKVCRDELGFDYLLDITSIDNFGAEPRFEVVYELYQLENGDHLRLKIAVSEDDLEVPTVSDVWATADWHEREAYDMFGIDFPGHPDLRRILCADDWEGFPLRKDYQFPREYHGIPGSVELDWQHKPDYPG